MKLKEIKPGMVIHWETADEMFDLLEELERLGYEWYGTHEKPTKSCREKAIGHVIYVYNDCGWKNITNSGNMQEVTHEFSDLVIPELTAEEAIQWLGEHYLDGAIEEVFGDDYAMDQLTKEFTPDEIVAEIAKWKSDHEKKELEIETVDICRIIEIQPDGHKKCVHEEDIKSDLPFSGNERAEVEEILKNYCMEHKGEFIAVHEVVSRVKAVK